VSTTSGAFSGFPSLRTTPPSAVDRHTPALIVTGEDQAEIRHLWEQASRTAPALREFASRRLIELTGVHTSVDADLHVLPDAALVPLGGHLRRVVARQSGPGLAYIRALDALLREEQERRLRRLVGQG
jgi:hypothetical protein